MLDNISTSWISKIIKLKKIVNKSKYKILIKLKKIAIINNINDCMSVNNTNNLLY